MTACDNRVRELAQGPLRHPERGQLFWFDILNRRLLSRDKDDPRDWRFDIMATASGRVDPDRLPVAPETGLILPDLRDGASSRVLPIEADNPATRSNDGRADPQGGFWIGTMGKSAQTGAGPIYRYHRGELRKRRASPSPTRSAFARRAGGALRGQARG